MPEGRLLIYLTQRKPSSGERRDQWQIGDMRKLMVFGVFGMAVLTGCSPLQPIQQDRALVLAKGDGIAAVQFNSPDNLNKIQLVAEADSSALLNIPDAPKGKSLYLFEVPAGNYCLQRLYFGHALIFNKGAKLGCFAVSAGQVGFSGEYQPHAASDGQVAVEQHLDAAYSQRQLQQAYPHIAAQFLQGEPEPAVEQPATAPVGAHPQVGDEQVSTWVDQSRTSDSIYFRNNTQWPITLTAFALYQCANVKQECKLEHPDFRLAPHETRKFMDVLPTDTRNARAFLYLIEYDVDPKQPKK